MTTPVRVRVQLAPERRIRVDGRAGRRLALVAAARRSRTAPSALAGPPAAPARPRPVPGDRDRPGLGARDPTTRTTCGRTFYAAHGFAVLTADKRGVGASGGRYVRAATEANLRALAADALAGVAWLRRQPSVDPQPDRPRGRQPGRLDDRDRRRSIAGRALRRDPVGPRDERRPPGRLRRAHARGRARPAPGRRGDRGSSRRHARRRLRPAARPRLAAHPRALAARLGRQADEHRRDASPTSPRSRPAAPTTSPSASTPAARTRCAAPRTG